MRRLLLAMLLARRRHRVLLLERARFPSDTVSTHYIHQPGVARLKRWGLLDRLRATRSPALAEAIDRGLALRVARREALTPPARQLYEAIAADREWSNRFCGLNAETVDPDTFFSGA